MSGMKLRTVSLNQCYFFARYDVQLRRHDTKTTVQKNNKLKLHDRFWLPL